MALGRTAREVEQAGAAMDYIVRAAGEVEERPQTTSFGLRGKWRRRDVRPQLRHGHCSILRRLGYPGLWKLNGAIEIPGLWCWPHISIVPSKRL